MLAVLEKYAYSWACFFSFFLPIVSCTARRINSLDPIFMNVQSDTKILIYSFQEVTFAGIRTQLQKHQHFLTWIL